MFHLHWLNHSTQLIIISFDFLDTESFGWSIIILNLLLKTSWEKFKGKIINSTLYVKVKKYYQSSTPHSLFCLRVCTGRVILIYSFANTEKNKNVSCKKTIWNIIIYFFLKKATLFGSYVGELICMSAFFTPTSEWILIIFFTLHI